MPVVVTAGHVDHGKSTLVQALTGRDPDRWAEEKRRGLTIDLGFAWSVLGDENVAFVDVPGHGRFIKNMLAGVGAVDAAMFVVAADEGWMPQSEEHMAVLDLLGVSHGVVALTRTDLVDPEVVELAAAEVRDHTAGTGLGDWAVVAVSPVTGAGLDHLRTALSEALAGRRTSRASAPADGIPQMWIDRAFVAEGAGVVVTGAPTGGPLRRGDLLEVWPGGARVRIRAIQSREIETEMAYPGMRAALNLSGIERDSVGRGAMMTVVGGLRPSRRLLAGLVPARAWPGAIGDRGAFHLHVGTGHWPMRVRLLAGRSLTEPGAAMVHLDQAIPLRMGDRFVVRDVGRGAVVGGGVVLDPHPLPGTPQPGVAEALRIATGGKPDAMAESLLVVRGTADLAHLAIDSGGGAPPSAVICGETAITSQQLEAVAAAMVETVAGFHRSHPLRPGIPKATLASTLATPPPVIDAVLARRGSKLRETAALVSLIDFQPTLGGDETEAWERAEQRLRTEAPVVPRLVELGLDPEMIHALVRQGRLVVVGDYGYLPDQLETIVAGLADLGDAEAGFTVAEFRDSLQVSRRHAVPLLEWMDSAGHTVRRGDTRHLRRRRPPASDAAPTR